MGLLAVWYRNFWGLQTRVVLPYAQRLRLLPAYLQQLHMESNGKRVDLEGSAVGCETGSIVWGAAGTGGQHSFHQLLHQGTTVVPADFIVFARPDVDTAHLPKRGVTTSRSSPTASPRLRPWRSARPRTTPIASCPGTARPPSSWPPSSPPRRLAS